MDADTSMATNAADEAKEKEEKDGDGDGASSAVSKMKEDGAGEEKSEEEVAKREAELRRAAEEALEKGRDVVLSDEEKFALCRSVGEECIQESELMNLLKHKPVPVCYDGFEPSGRMHIAQGVMKALNVNKLTRAGCVFKFWCV